jgi:aqualysin 1
MRQTIGLALLTLAACAAPNDEDDAVDTLNATTDPVRHVARAASGRYIVVLKEPANEAAVEATPAAARRLTALYGGRVTHTYEAVLRGFALDRLSAADARRLANDASVKYVEEDGIVTANAVQTNPGSWGIDRVDSRGDSDGKYTYNATGAGVSAYVVDTGIRIDHREFAGRAAHGFSAVNDGHGSDDCHGHGTHVAGTIGGTKYGIAKDVKLFAVRVLDCEGSGDDAQVIAGIDWVTQHGARPAVINMSLGGDASTALDDAVRSSVRLGVVNVVAAGNEGTDACRSSPSRVREAITVGATEYFGNRRTSWSNYGECLDLFAPGNEITSAWNGSASSTNTISGTSMATPHVVGAVALYLERFPSANPETVTTAILGNASKDKVFGAGPDTVNRLLYTGFIPASP